MDIDKVKKQAEAEIAEEDFRYEVDRLKAKLRSKKTIWDVIFPYKILIIRKEV